MTQVTVEQAMLLAIQHHRAGRLAEAEAIYGHILAAQPNHADALCNLGNILCGRDQLDDAVTCYQRALALRPDFVEVLTSLGTAWRRKGQLDKAIACHQRALILNPNSAEVHNNLGAALKDKGQFDQAIASYRQALTLKPDFAEAHSNLGVAFKCTRKIDEAIARYERALALKPDYAEAFCNMGTAYGSDGRLDQAIACYQRALAIKPDFAGAHYNLGTAFKDTGQVDLAVASFRRALALDPRFVAAHDNLLLAMPYDPACDAQSIYAECRRWSHQHADPLKRLIKPHTNNRDPARPLRIGYISPDLYNHPVGRFILPILAAHDRNVVQIVCYANVSVPDAVTAMSRSRADTWHDIFGHADQQIADTIRDDKIDILVDLALHTAGNSLLAFARKPAPIQLTWLGYPGTTGLDVIDYRLTDPYLDPPDTDEICYSEHTVHLPDTFWCYDPRQSEPAVNALPALQNGFITFGCLNNFCKVNDHVISLWAKVLNTVAASRLILLAPEGRSRERVLDRLASADISADRVEFPARQPHADYLHNFHRIDIALDTTPYNGHTTSLDSLWMGVPVITLVGHTIVGRAGLSQLTNLGLTELIAYTPEQYVQIAADLAADRSRLAELRSTLRQRMQNSPLMDAKRMTSGLEDIFRTLWQSWCAT